MCSEYVGGGPQPSRPAINARHSRVADHPFVLGRSQDISVSLTQRVLG